MNSRSAQQNTTPEHDDTSRPDQSPPSERWRFEDGKPVLVGSRCGHCGKVTFPFEGTCDRCLEANPEAFELPREGQLYSFTVVHTAPAGFTTPYHLGYVDLPNDVRVLAQLRPNEAPFAPGDQVELDIAPIRVLGDGTPVESYVFRPVGAAQS
jgi:uncharacterized OB-fold protein